MKICKIRVQNLVGIEEFEVTPGNLTLIEGKNGKGKTSVLKAIQTAIGGGDYADLMRKGSGKAEAVLVLDDGTEIKRTMSMDTEGKVSGKVTVTNGDGMKAAKPQTYLDALCNPLQTNPLTLLLTDKKSRDERLKALLEAVPSRISKEELIKKFPAATKTAEQLDYSRHALEVYDSLHKIVFESRRDVNRDAKKLTGTIAELTSSLEGKKIDENIDAELTQLAEAKAKLEELRDKYNEQFADELRAAEKAASDTLAATVDLLTQEDNEKLELINQDYAVKLQELNAWKEQHVNLVRETSAKARANAQAVKDNALDAAGKQYIANKDAKLSAFNSKYEPVTQRIAELQATKENEGMIRMQMKMKADAEAEFNALDAKSKAMSAVLESVDAAKLELLKSIPIKGLEIVDGDIVYNGISFDMLNTAKRIDLAVEIAKLGAGKLGIICVDGLENFDSETLAAFEAKCAESDLQVIATRVTDDAVLTVHTVK